MDAELSARNALAHEDGLDNYNHPERRPDSVANSILALSSIDSVDYESAQGFADTAVRLDVGCSIARNAFATSAKLMGETTTLYLCCIRG